jgi:hypothetical protein
VKFFENYSFAYILLTIAILSLVFASIILIIYEELILLTLYIFKKTIQKFPALFRPGYYLLKGKISSGDEIISPYSNRTCIGFCLYVYDIVKLWARSKYSVRFRETVSSYGDIEFIIGEIKYKIPMNDSYRIKFMAKTREDIYRGLYKDASKALQEFIFENSSHETFFREEILKVQDTLLVIGRIKKIENKIIHFDSNKLVFFTTQNSFGILFKLLTSLTVKVIFICIPLCLFAYGVIFSVIPFIVNRLFISK